MTEGDKSDALIFVCKVFFLPEKWPKQMSKANS